MAEIKITQHAWLGSEKGLVLKTHTVDSTKAPVVTEVDAYGVSHSVVKSGAIYQDATNGVYGLVFNDTDVTGGAVACSVMVAGHYIDAKLPASASAQASNFAAQGLFPVKQADATRPEWANK